MGEIYLRVGEIKKAIECYHKALDLDGNDSDVLYTLATIYEEEGNISKQAEILVELLPLVNYPERLVDKMAEIHKSRGEFKNLVDLERRGFVELLDNDE